MTSTTTPKLFQPIKVGPLNLEHRIVHAPLTRFKNTKHGCVPVQPMVKEYYSQRATTPGTFIIGEATLISDKVGGYHNVPGIYTDEQIDSWKQVVSAVHEKGSYMFCQLWALGRVAEPWVLRETNPPRPYVAPSPTEMPDHNYGELPREYTKAEIKEVVRLYVQAAKNAVFKAGFDGIEIHGANGYLFDQFLQDMTNFRSDEYGGSIENRSRFGFEVVDAIADAIGEERMGIRLSPWSPFQGMGMEDPIPQFAHFVSTLKMRHPKLAYIHVIEPRIDGPTDRSSPIKKHESNDFLRAIWKPGVYIAAGGFDREKALVEAEETGGLVTFGRHFLANPDLPVRLQKNISLNKYHRPTFYIPVDGAENPSAGYTDYPFAKDV
ncbi:hypothetical protein AMATHDRAFT_64614 [Amanita thiersii Skay4041]|uniref:NADH:flavin oxidoreductase/NADH oxidase N-terminal domain-containing protein n=1 Tax=Amanita thiersii Skay4041 TaxID=703135 RepID=A0A2A9NKK0_9AGAR|nr:hypothetical protein AMATHDRAFT_64614 [Amanita thiersii Skay4041]